VISQVGAAMAFLWILRPRLARAAIRTPNRAGLAPLASAGGHLVIRVASMMVVFGGATAVAARIDDVTLAAHQVAMSLFLFLALTLDALAVPAQTIVAEELGRDNRASARLVAERAVRLSIFTGLALGAVVAVLAPFLPDVFTTDPEVAARATSALWWLAALLLPGAVAFAYDGVLIGAADYRFLGRAAFGYLLAVVPFAVVTLWYPSIGIAGIWSGMAAWMVLRAVVNHRRTRHIL
jgi:Na+-driven multidrug efflux pump